MSDGTRFPAFEECPECGNDRFSAIENARQGVTIVLDGSGGVATVSTDDLIATSYSFLECLNCEARLIEDGEVIHDDIEGPGVSA